NRNAAGPNLRQQPQLSKSIEVAHYDTRATDVSASYENLSLVFIISFFDSLSEIAVDLAQQFAELPHLLVAQPRQRMGLRCADRKFDGAPTTFAFFRQSRTHLPAVMLVGDTAN